MKIPLPTGVGPCVASIRWPLGPSDSPPMYYQPLAQLTELRNRACAPTASLSSSKVRVGRILSDVDGLVEMLSSPLLLPDDDYIFSSGNDVSPKPPDHDRKRHLSIVSAALLLLGNGRTDEAHNLVTPLSWPEPTGFGHGPSRYSSADPDAVSAASYVHSLVHRREGHNVGEYNMVGYQNANYWTNAALKSRAADGLPWRKIREAVLLVARGNPAAEAWCRERVVDEGIKYGDADSYWEPRAMHELCAKVSYGADINMKHLKDFAERAAEVELRTLLFHCLELAGYDIGEDRIFLNGNEEESAEWPSIVNMKVQHATLEVNEDNALVAAGIPSSAHLGAFRVDGHVTLRNVLLRSHLTNVQSDDRTAAFSTAFGLASRLLESPACRLAKTREDEENRGMIKSINIVLPTNDADVDEANAFVSGIGSGYHCGGGALSPGDVFAFVAPDSSEDLIASLGVKEWWFTLAACASDDERAIFVDRLYGTRGETPTSVVQWSKGTVHNSLPSRTS